MHFRSAIDDWSDCQLMIENRSASSLYERTAMRSVERMRSAARCRDEAPTGASCSAQPLDASCRLPLQCVALLLGEARPVWRGQGTLGHAWYHRQTFIHE